MILFVVGYVVYRKGDFEGGNIIKLKFNFRTEMRNGMMLFAHGGSGVYFLVQLINGDIHAEFRDGTEHILLIYPNKMMNNCDGKWHFVTIFKRNQYLAMQVDSHPSKGFPAIGDSSVVVSLPIVSDLYIGGIKPGSEAEQFINTFDISIQESKLLLF